MFVYKSVRKKALFQNLINNKISKKKLIKIIKLTIIFVCKQVYVLEKKLFFKI